MTTPWERSDGSFICPVCKASVPCGTVEPCGNCDSDTSDPLYRKVVEADEQMFAYRTQYDEIMGKWHELAAERRMWMAQLLSAKTPWKTARQVGPVKWGGAATPLGQEASTPAWSDVVAAANVEAPVARTVAPPLRAPKSRPERRPRHRLTAPTLLGISGASMLITAAIVFIAVTWDTIFPLAQGLLVLAVAGAIAWLSLWLSRHDLLISGGAVGVVAMAFAGVAVIAFNRAEVGLGDYAVTTALLASALSGYALAKRDVQWVGPLAALTFVAAPASLALTFAGHTGSGSPGLSTVVGVLAGVAMGLTLKWWTTQPERWIVTVGYTVVVALSVIPAGLALAREGSFDPLLLCAALLPVVVLAVAGKWMPDVTIGPAVLVLTAVTVAAVAGPTGHASPSIAGGAIAGAVAIALISRAPKTWRIPALIGAIPMAVGGLALLAGEVWRLLTWAAAFRLGGIPPIIDGWAAITALALAFTIAATRLWRNRPERVRELEVSGAVLATAGFAGLAFPVNSMFPWPDLFGLAFVLEIAGAATALTALAWTESRARKVSGVGGVIVGTLGALNAVWPLAQRTLPLGVALALGLVPAFVMAIGGRWWPRITLGPAALLVPVIAAAAVANGDHWERASAIGAAVVAAILWAGLRMPNSWRIPIAMGLAVPLGGVLVASLWWSLPPLALTLTHGAVEAGPIDVWGGLTAAFAGAALAALTRWRIPSITPTHFGVTGALITLTAAFAWGFEAASQWGDGMAVAVAWTGSVAALVAATFAMLWVSGPAKLTSGAGAVLLVVISGFNGIVALAAPEAALPTAIGAVVLPIALLAAFARWWPDITLAPAALVATAATASVAHRLGLPSEAMAAFAATAAALLAWVVKPWPNRLRHPLAVGLFPAIIVAAWISVFALSVGLLAVVDASGTAAIEASWATATMLAGVAAAAAWRSGWGAAKGLGVANGLGALFSAVAAAAGTGWFALSSHGSPGLVTVVGTGTAVLAALTALVWTTSTGRWAAGVCAVGWATFCALPTLSKVSSGDYPVWLGLGAVAVTVVVLVAGSVRWPSITLGSVSLLVSLGAVCAVTGSGYDGRVVAGAASVAVLVWIATLVGPDRAKPLRMGAVPVGAIIAGMLVTAAGFSLGRFTDVAFGNGSQPIAAGKGIAAVLGAIAVFSWPAARSFAAWALLPFAFAASGALPHPWASVSMLAIGVAGAVAIQRLPAGGWATKPDAIVAFLAVGAGWSAGDHFGLAGAALIAALASGWLTRVSDLVDRLPPLVGTHVFAAIAAGVGVSAMGGHAPAAYGAAMAAVLGVSLWIRASGLEPEMTTTLVTIVGATIMVPLFAPSLTAAGVATLIAGVGWLGHAVLGDRDSRWISSVVLSIGAAEVLAGAQVNVIEAYTAVPAGTALAIGLWWLAEDEAVRTFRALGPGLGLALIPSYFALAVQPESLARTLALTAATVVLAFVGVTMRWFAPIVATCVTAVTVSLTQVAVGSDIVPRWVSFGIVGAILLAIAATYEKLQRLR